MLVSWVSAKLLDWVTRYRGLFVTLIVIPMSLVFEAVTSAWHAYLKSRHAGSAASSHDERVAAIQQRVRGWRDATGGKVKMCTGRAGWLTVSLRSGLYKKTHYRVDIPLYSVLDVDTKRGVVRVEPMVEMGQLSKVLLPKGYMLAVVPELDTLTVGGLINGFGVESTSHRFGLFQHICESFDIVLPDGSLKHCTATENADLFHAIPWSYGSIGFLVAAEIRIVPSKPFVHIRYDPCTSRADIMKRFSVASRRADAADFVECLMYDPERAVLMEATLVDKPPKGVPVNEINRFYKPWFYKHVEGFLRRGRSEECIPLYHYLHRHTRTFFWEIENIIPFGNSAWFRYTFGILGAPSMRLLKLTQTQGLQELYEKHHIDQDFLVSMDRLDATLHECHRLFSVYPLWLCPMRIPKVPAAAMVQPAGDVSDDMYVDIGYVSKRDIRDAEAFLRKTGGYQALYADTYMTRDEFRKMFDHRLLDAVRAKYGCVDALPEPFEKVNKAARA